MKRHLLSAISGVLVLGTVAASAADVIGKLTLRPTGEATGKISWSPSRRAYQVIRGNIQQDYELAQVERVQVQKPAGWDEALKKRDVKYLEAILKEYTMLEYDVYAGTALAKIYFANGRTADSLRVCKAVLNSNKNAVQTELAPIYWKSLLAAGEGANLAATLDEAIQKGNPAVVPGALIVRGDLLRAEGKRQEALADGYLRVIAFYRRNAEACAEALGKAADTFEELHQNRYAEQMRTELFTRFPNSDEARKRR